MPYPFQFDRVCKKCGTRARKRLVNEPITERPLIFTVHTMLYWPTEPGHQMKKCPNSIHLCDACLKGMAANPQKLSDSDCRAIATALITSIGDVYKAAQEAKAS